jgi:hypothetical protein
VQTDSFAWLQGQGSNKDIEVREQAADLLLICGEFWDVERMLWIAVLKDVHKQSHVSLLQVCASDVCVCMYMCMYVCVYMYVCMYVHGWLLWIAVVKSEHEQSNVSLLQVCASDGCMYVFMYVCMYACT